MLDQPQGDMLRLETILEAFASYDELEQKRAEAKAKNKGHGN